eukprot:SAG31_NODE_20078_length_584_cov_1.068041_2_plen_69_part_01
MKSILNVCPGEVTIEDTQVHVNGSAGSHRSKRPSCGPRIGLVNMWSKQGACTLHGQSERSVSAPLPMVL